MYLEHEELLKLVNTLEKERDEARTEVVKFANLTRHYRVQHLIFTIDPDYVGYWLDHDLLVKDCDELVRRYTPQ